MEILFVLILLIFIIFVTGVVIIGKIRNKKETEKFIQYFSKLERKREMLQALNDYKEILSPTDYLVEIEESYGDVKRTYMKELNEKIVFGRNFSQSEICIYDEDADPVQFAIMLKQEVPIIKSMSNDRETTVQLKNKHGRGNKPSVRLGFNDEIKVFTGDVVEIGRKKFAFKIWNRKKGII